MVETWNEQIIHHVEGTWGFRIAPGEEGEIIIESYEFQPKTESYEDDEGNIHKRTVTIRRTKEFCRLYDTEIHHKLIESLNKWFRNKEK